jgi:uncharacterized protein
MKENLYADGMIRTHSGIYLNPLYPSTEDIVIEDIAHALSNICRFAGHTNRFYSVAEHSVWVATHVNKIRKNLGRIFIDHKLVLSALMHDAAEAYLLDLPTPIKKKLAAYSIAEDNLLQIIARKYNFDYPFTEEIHLADKRALEYEWNNIVIADLITPMGPLKAKQAFLDHFSMYHRQD